MPFEVSTHARDRSARDGAELRDADLEVRQQLEQERLELLVGAVDLVDQQHRRLFAPDRGEQRALQQVALGEDVLLDRVGVLADAFARLDGEELALIVPLVERGVLVEALVALQADQLGAVHGGERLGDLGLADAGLAFEQQRPLEELHQPQRGRDVAVGDVADGGEAVGDGVARKRHGQSTVLYCAARRRRGPANHDPGYGKPRRSAPQRTGGRLLASSPDCTAEPRQHGRYACSPSLSAAIQVRQWSCGIGMWVEPRNAKASFTALAKHGTPPTFGLSPTPLAPIG